MGGPTLRVFAIDRHSGPILEPREPLPQSFALVRPQITVLPPPDGSMLTAYGYPNSRSTLTKEGLAVITTHPHVSRARFLRRTANTGIDLCSTSRALTLTPDSILA